MPDISTLCPATRQKTVLTLSRQRKPEACIQEATCTKRHYIKCCLHNLKITGGKSV